MDACLRCQSETKLDARGGKDCVVVWGDCNHSFHQVMMIMMMIMLMIMIMTVLHEPLDQAEQPVPPLSAGVDSSETGKMRSVICDVYYSKVILFILQGNI